MIDDGIAYFGSSEGNLHAVSALTGSEVCRYKTSGQVVSTLVVHDGTVYFGDADRTFYALDVSVISLEAKDVPVAKFQPAMFGSGPMRNRIFEAKPLEQLSKVKWQFQPIGARPRFGAEMTTVAPTHRKGSNGGVRSTPALVDGTLFFGSEDGHVYSVDADSVEENWSLEIPRNFALRGLSPVESSPAVVNGVVYFGSIGNYLYALDVKSGQEKWRFRTDGGVFSSRLVTADSAYFGSWDGWVYAVDTASGAERWRFNTGEEVWFSPAGDGDTVFIGSDNGWLFASDARTGEERWNFQAGDSVTSTPALGIDRNYFGSMDNHLYALDSRTGQLEWRC